MYSSKVGPGGGAEHIYIYTNFIWDHTTKDPSCTKQRGFKAFS